VSGNLETETFLITEVTGEIEDGGHTTDFSLDDFIEKLLLDSRKEKEVDGFGVAGQERWRKERFEALVDILGHERGKSRLILALVREGVYHTPTECVKNIKKDIERSDRILLAKRTLQSWTVQTNIDIRKIREERKQLRHHRIQSIF
jgi:hypothetical protein